MIPLRDTIDSRTYPITNSALIGINLLVYLVQLGQGDQLQRFIITYGLVPARYSVPEIAVHFSLGQQVFAFLSFMFVHGGFWHLLGNMWCLYIFGDNVEGRLGSLKYLLFYLLCGFASGLTHLSLNWHSHLPTVGASGAIAGVMGAYFLLYPHSKILTFIPIFFIPYFIEIPAFFFLGLWFILQFISAAGTPDQGGGIAWWAHIGGFFFGMVFLKIFLRTPETVISRQIRQKTSKKKSNLFQLIKPKGVANDTGAHGTVVITQIEARLGTRKILSIPSGARKRFLKVTVPPGSRNGSLIRLSGAGRQLRDGTRQDIYLRIKVA
ncbi:MAG: rhomboid family intramembrane serine protease [Deltaproteobacteria bacterium]|jgi:membrane associated rhomboid family serine protease